MSSAIAALEGKVEVLDREEWLRIHYDPEHISASQVAGSLGYSDYKSPLMAYSERHGDIDPPETSIAMELGHFLEPIVAKYYENETGRVCEDPGDYAIIRHPDMPQLFCTVDRVTVNEAHKPGNVELKTTNQFQKKKWKDGLGPIEYQIQAQVQSMCCDFPWGSLAVLIGNTEFLYHDYKRSDDLEEELLKGVDGFLQRLREGNPPEASWQDTEILKVLHPRDNGETIRIDTDEAAALMTLFGDLKDDEKEIKKDLKDAQNKLTSLIGDNTFIESKFHKYSYKTQGRITKASVEPEDVQRLKDADIPYNPGKHSTHRVLRKMKK